MSAAQNVHLEIGGSVHGHVAIGDHNVQIGNVNGIVVNVSPSKGQPAYQRRQSPVDLRPRAFPSLLDREQETDLVVASLGSLTPVSIFGGEGVGKTALIRRLAHSPKTNDFVDGVIYLDGSQFGLNDLLQSIFDAFHESHATYQVDNADVRIVYKPTDAEIRIALRSVKAILFIDNCGLSRNDVEQVLSALPGSALILAGLERSIWGEGEAVALHGLPPTEAVRLFERELGRGLTETEQLVVADLVMRLDCHPLRILQTASLMRETSRSIVEMAAQLEGPAPEQKLAESSLHGLTETQQKVLSILAASDGMVVPIAHIRALAASSGTQDALKGLVSLGLAQAHSPRYSLAGNLGASLSGVWDLSGWEDALINYLAEWIVQQPQEALVDESTNLLLHTIRKAAEKKRWQQVIQIGRAFERYLTLWKRWQAWADVLEWILQAARALGDRQVEAWALHQLGSRLMGLGVKDQAERLLRQSLETREAIGDSAGLSVTQHNLDVLLGKPIVVPRGGSGPGPWLAIGAVVAGVALLTVVLVTAALLFFGVLPNPFAPPTATPTPSPTLTATPVPPTLTPHPATVTLTLTPTETSTPTTIPVIVRAIGNNTLRRGPDLAYNPMGQLLQGQSAPATARNQQGTWLYITPPGSGRAAWIRLGRITDVSGDPASLPVRTESPAEPAYIRNCTFHDMRSTAANGAEEIIPRYDDTSTQHIVQFLPGSYSIDDTTTAGIPPVQQIELFEGQTVDINTDGLGNTYFCS